MSKFCLAHLKVYCTVHNKNRSSIRTGGLGANSHTVGRNHNIMTCGDFVSLGQVSCGIQNHLFSIRTCVCQEEVTSHEENSKNAWCPSHTHTHTNTHRNDLLLYICRGWSVWLMWTVISQSDSVWEIVRGLFLQVIKASAPKVKSCEKLRTMKHVQKHII